MTAKEKILNTIRSTTPPETPLPSLEGLDLTFDDPLETFKTMLESVGGELVEDGGWKIEDGGWRSVVERYYPDADVIVSNVLECDVATLDLESVDDPHDLSTVDLAIVQAAFAVAENGAVWVKNADNRHRALYFIAENIIFVVPRGEIVHTMHEAYERIGFEEGGFGCLISGPSKTADIEQSLVIGAHGAKSAYVIFV